jgi:hypothetical protein
VIRKKQTQQSFQVEWPVRRWGIIIILDIAVILAILEVKSALLENQGSPSSLLAVMSSTITIILAGLQTLFGIWPLSQQVKGTIRPSSIIKWINILICALGSLSILGTLLYGFSSGVNNQTRTGGAVPSATVPVYSSPYVPPVVVPVSPSSQVTTSPIASQSPIVTPSPDPSAPIHFVSCTGASANARILRVTTTATTICFSGVGTLNNTIASVVKIETNGTFASWAYTTISTGNSHYSPKVNFFHCPGKRAPYIGKQMAQVTQISLTLYAAPCIPHSDS